MTSRSRVVGVAVLALLAGTAVPCAAEVLLSEARALEQAFPGAVVKRRTLYLTEEQVTAVEQRARSRMPSAIVTVYEARSGDEIVGRAVLDTSIVRTMPATLLSAVDSDGTFKMALVLQFTEPPDYLPREGWLERFAGRVLDDDLWPGRGVHAVTGATLTVHAFTDAVRRALALDALVLRSPE